MPIWQAVLLGIVQGLTEFLPISSTAHLLLVQEYFFGRTPEQLKKDPITVVIQLGTLAAVLVYFRRDILQLARAFVQDLYENRLVTSATPEGRMAKLIILGSVPVVVAGVLFKNPLNDNFRNAKAIAIVAIVFAVLMAASEWYAACRLRKGLAQRNEAYLTWADAVFVGLFQALALMPGASRSGTTITAGLFAGLTRGAAARFSFLLSLPSVFGAGMKEIYDWRKTGDPVSQDDILALLVGTVVSAVVGYASIAWLMSFLRKYPMWVFVAYRIIGGVAILVLIRAGVR